MSQMYENFTINTASRVTGIEMSKILLVSNNEDVKLTLCAQLNLSQPQSQQQFKQLQYDQSITEFEHLHKSFSPDLIIIDLQTVTQSKMEMYMKIVKLHFHVPLLGLSTIQGFNLTEKVAWFVDDLLLKPYTNAELYFRVNMLLGLYDKDKNQGESFPLFEGRNSGDRRQLPQNNNNTKNSLIRIDGNTKRIYFNHIDMKLGPIAYKLFCLLIKQTGEAVSIEEISASLWPVCKKDKENEIRVYINHLRAQIEKFPHHPCWIETVKNIGYRFILDKHCL